MEAGRDALLAPKGEAAPAPVAALAGLRGIGPEFAAVLWLECFFRSFSNRRQVAAYAGLAPTPWQSGSVDHEQGVSQSGNPKLRSTMIQPRGPNPSGSHGTSRCQQPNQHLMA